MNSLKEAIKKYGFGFVLGAITIDSYRRQLLSDNDKVKLDLINKDREELDISKREAYDNALKEEVKRTNSTAKIGTYHEAVEEHKKCADAYAANPGEYTKQELDKAKEKLDVALQDILKSDISEYFISIYNNYTEFLSSLTPDKIVCIFNIITGGLVLSSFLSILSIMLSENIINKIQFLEKYPRILNLLKLRNNINKKVAKFYLLMHILAIMFGILGNIIMFFI